MRGRWAWALLLGLLVLASFTVLAQEEPSQAELEAVLKQTGADEVIVKKLGWVLIGKGVIDDQLLAFGVTLKIAAELEEYPGLKVDRWLKEKLGREPSKAELNWMDMVKGSLQTSYPDLYGSLREALKNLRTKPTVQPGSDLSSVLTSLQTLNQRLTSLEDRVTALTQQRDASAEELAALRQEFESLKESLPDPAALSGLSANLPQMASLQDEVSRLNRSQSSQRGLTIFLIILVFLLLTWLVFLRAREISRVL
ncbi:MAG: hypothetical protein NUW06_01795 [Candidatus Acetothermia bacterium]|jgi:regulator of replication initiation timing|nr:hypothetical protein [Candidatus Acetothermia bacterium]MDH7504696.1 hypothetical protein [Candidatus Acetothermia bacterium]